jgi:hypothetical protein
MPVKRRLDKRRPEADGTLFRLLSDLPAEPGDNLFERRYTSCEKLREAWEVHHQFIVIRWVKEHPGSRPSYWWKFSALEPRRRLGGTGTPMDEAFNYVPSYRFGIPDGWVNAWEVELYSGRVMGIDGKPIVSSDRGFIGVPPDPNDPPVYESEASYLRRLGLLLPGEAARLTPEDFEPVALEIEQVPEGQNPYRSADR